MQTLDKAIKGLNQEFDLLLFARVAEKLAGKFVKKGKPHGKAKPERRPDVNERGGEKG